ncbi:MAG: hypothetical protein ACP5SH_17765 [Syntrophobacteraceae bacterium]
MANRNSEKNETRSGCFVGMQEMMRRMMSESGGPRCPLAERMTEMMEGCCGFRTQKDDSKKEERAAPRYPIQGLDRGFNEMHSS